MKKTTYNVLRILKLTVLIFALCLASQSLQPQVANAQETGTPIEQSTAGGEPVTVTRTAMPGPNVGVLSYCTDLMGPFGAQNLVNTLVADGRFGTVTLVDADVVQPTAQDLIDQFACVITMTDNRCGGESPSDALAGFAQSGAGVVLATFGYSFPNGIGFSPPIFGPGLSPFQTVGSGNASAGAIDVAGASTSPPCDALMAGVTAPVSSSFANEVSLSAGATLCTSYTNGRDLLAINAAENVVGLNSFPNTASDHLQASYRNLISNSVAAVCSSIDFSVTKTVSNSKPAFGEVVTFTVTVTNPGPAAVSGVEVTDLLPAGLTFVGATSTKGSYNPGSGVWGIGAMADGASETLTIDALVTGLDPITNTATVTASSPSGGGSASATVTPQAADLAIDKTVDNDDPAVGDIVAFTVTVSHLDGADVIGTRVEDQLPGGLNYVSHITTQGSYDPGTGNWQVGSLTEGQMESLVIMAEVIDAGGITNTAFIAFASQPDPFPGDNRDAASLNADAADLEVIKRVVAFSTEDGTITATFVVTVTNEGPSDVGGVVVTDELSPDMTEQSSVASQGTVVSAGSTLTWDVGALADGASATLTVTVTVPQSGSLLNTAEVTASDLPDPDSEPDDGEGDDFAAATAGPRQVPDFVPGAGPGGVLDRGDRFAADLALTKDVSVEGTSATYTIMVENLGPQSTARVEVTDHLPDCLSYDSSSADRGAYDPDTWIWTIGELKVGEKVTLEIVTTIGEECDGEVVNTATITSSSLPDPSSFFDLFGQPAAEANNSAEATFTVSSGRELDGRRFALGTNYPNPFNPTTVIPFSVAEASHVSIKVYDLLGRTVATLVDGTMSAGVHEVSFEAGSLPTGMYLVRMEASGQVYTQRMTLMK